MPVLTSLSRRVLFLTSTALLAGCLPSRTTMYETPRSFDPVFDGAHPASVEYVILGQTTGSACGNLQDYLLSGGAAKTFSGPVHPQILEAARFDALNKSPGADNLMFVRVEIKNEGYDQCATVTGKAYRVGRMQSGDGAPNAPAASTALAPPPSASMPAVAPAVVPPPVVAPATP